MNPAMQEDRSGLFKEIGGFSQRKLKKVEMKVCTGLGETVVEKRGAKGLQTIKPSDKSSSSASNEPPKKLDLQVGLVAPGIMIGSHDVVHHKQTLDEYGITHILNLACDEIENLFEDELNYCSIQIDDRESTQLEKFFDEAFGFLDDGRQRGNCLIHCNASKPGLSRSTSICIAYLMHKEKKKFTDAFNDVKEARSFVRPSDHFMKQLQSLNEELFGAKKKDEIEDAFTRKKRQEIEAEKQMLKSQTVKLKDRAKLFAESVTPERSQSPSVNSSSPTPGSVAKKWQPVNGTNEDDGRRKSFVPDYVSSANGRSDSIDSQTGAPRKLTSIISLFNKPKDENSNTIVSNEHRPSFSVTNTAPAKKWKTVEPPPRPGFLKKNKSRRFVNNNESIKRNKSKGNLEEKIKIKATKQSSLNQSQDSGDGAKAKVAEVAKVPQVNGTIKRQNSRQDSVTKKSPTTTPVVAPKTQVTKVEPPKPQPMKSALKTSTVPAPPPPPPQPPVLKSVPPPPPPPPPPKDDDPTPWRRSSSRTPEPKQVPIQVQTSIDSEYRMKPDETRYKSSFSVNPARRGSKTEPEPETKKVSSTIQKTVSPKLPDVVPAPPERTVFGKVKPPQMKIVGSTLSTEKKPQPKPEPIKEVTKPAPIKEVTKPAPPVSNKPKYQRSVSVDDDDDEEEEDEDEEEEEEEDDDGDFTQIYDYRNKGGLRESDLPSYQDSRRLSSEVKGLNRSSTTEILKLIKSKTGGDLVHDLDTLDEDEESGEIDALLDGLAEEGIDNIDWGELGIDVGEVKSIVNKHENDEEEEEEDEDEEEDEEVETEEEEEEVECTVVLPSKFGLRAK